MEVLLIAVIKYQDAFYLVRPRENSMGTGAIKIVTNI